MNAGKGKLKKLKTKIPLKSQLPIDDDEEEDKTKDDPKATTDKKEMPADNFVIEEQREEKHARCASCTSKCIIY